MILTKLFKILLLNFLSCQGISKTILESPRVLSKSVFVSKNLKKAFENPDIFLFRAKL